MVQDEEWRMSLPKHICDGNKCVCDDPCSDGACFADWLWNRAVSEERDRCAKIDADEAEFAFNTYEGSRLHDFMSVAKHIEAQIMMKPHPRDNMRGIIYKNSARIISET